MDTDPAPDTATSVISASSSSEVPTSAIDERTKRLTLVAMVICSALVFLDSTVVNLALPAIQRDFGISTAAQQWVASSYLLTLSALLLAGGRLGDLWGRRRLLRVGTAAYAVIAIAAALSPNAPVLTLLRGAQGVAGALLVPTSLAIINAVFPPKERGRAIGQWAAWSGIATVLGPILGGAIIDHASWRIAFLITPVAAVATWVLSAGVPESCDQTSEQHIDVAGIVLAALSLGGIIFALIEGPITAWDRPAVLLSAGLGVLLLPLFLWREATAAVPVMPFGLFADRDLSVANITTFFVYAGLYGQFFYIPIYLQTALRASATVSGVIFLPITLLLFFLSPLAGRLHDRYGPRWLLCFGPLIAASGIAIAAFAGPGQLWTVLMPGILVFGVGMGFTVTPVTATAIGAAEERYAGVASGFNNAVSRVAGLVAIALMGAVVVELWHAGIDAAARGASPEVLKALASVRDQAFVLPRAVGAGSAETIARATDAARLAFRNGMLVAAALVAVGGVVSAVGIRGRGDAGRED